MELIEETIARREAIRQAVRKYIFSSTKKDAKNFENVVNLDGSKYKGNENE